MKKLFFMIFFCIEICFLLYAESSNLINSKEFPVELSWWLNEVQKTNENIRIGAFKFYYNDTTIGIITDFSKEYFFKDGHTMEIAPCDQRFFVSGVLDSETVFKKWNYIGDVVAYYDFGAKIRHDFQTRALIFENNYYTNLFIQDYRNKIVYKVPYAPLTGICGMAWLHSNILVTVETSLHYDKIMNTTVVDLIISYILIDDDHFNKHEYNVKIEKYIYENDFTEDEYKMMKLKWYEHTPFFEEIIGECSF